MVLSCWTFYAIEHIHQQASPHYHLLAQPATGLMAS